MDERTARTMTTPTDLLLLDALPAMPGGSINLFDEELRYLYAAGAGLTDVGLDPSTLIGRTLTEVFGEPAASAVRPFYARALAGEAVSFEVTLGPRVYQISAARVPGRTGVILAIAQEITERRRANAELTERNQRKDEFIATLAHELRQPLAPMVVALDVMRKRISVQAGERAREVLSRQIRQLQRLTDDLLDAARINQGRSELRFERIDLRMIIEEVVAFSEYDIRAKSIALTTDLAEDAVWTYGDPVRLQQVFSNLLLNAVKFTGPGGQIAVSLARQGPWSVTRVTDTGRGISPEFLPHIFDMFAQTTQSGGGLGIGLAVVKRLVDRHGGTVVAHSRGDGLGAEFAVTLPISPAA